MQPDEVAGEHVELFVTQKRMQLGIIAAEEINQAQHIGVAIDAEKHVALLLRRIDDVLESRIVAVHERLLKAGLQASEVHHSAAASLSVWPAGAPSVSRARRRATSSSSRSSPSGGIWSSRSMIVDTGPKRRSA